MNYGLDVATSAGFDGSGRNVDGPRAVAECIVRRWSTSPDMVSDYLDDDECLDMVSFLSRALGADEIFFLGERMQRVAERDERVRECIVDVTYAGETLTVRAALRLEEEKTFRLVVAFSAAGSRILSFG